MRSRSRSRSRGGKVNLWVLGVGLSLVLVLVAILFSGFGKDPRAVPSVLDGRVAPPWTLADFEGQHVSLDGLRGTPVVLNFWSTWCGPCKYEHPILQEAQARNPDVRFLGVLYSDEPDKARRYLRGAGSAYPNLVDEGNRVAIDYGVAGVPETFFIDREGVIKHKFVGPLTWPTLNANLESIKGGR